MCENEKREERKERRRGNDRYNKRGLGQSVRIRVRGGKCATTELLSRERESNSVRPTAPPLLLLRLLDLLSPLLELRLALALLALLAVHLHVLAQLVAVLLQHAREHGRVDAALVRGDRETVLGSQRGVRLDDRRRRDGGARGVSLDGRGRREIVDGAKVASCVNRDGGRRRLREDILEGELCGERASVDQ